MPRPNDMVVVDRLPDLLSERSISQRDLAQRSGVGQSTISYAVKNGATREKNARKIASALGVTTEALAYRGLRRQPERAASERAADALERIADVLEWHFYT